MMTSQKFMPEYKFIGETMKTDMSRMFLNPDKRSTDSLTDLCTNYKRCVRSEL